MPEGSENGVKTITITGSGQKEFGTWSYYEAGTYSYIVSEINTGEAGYTYDTTIYTITDTVTAVEGQLIVETRVVMGDMGEMSAMSFTNAYRAPGAGPNTDDNSQLGIFAILAAGSGMLTLVWVGLLLADRRRNQTEHHSLQLFNGKCRQKIRLT